MNHYKSYMDRVTVSEELHRKLLSLEEPAKKPVRWRRYAVAACAALLVGVGVWRVGTRLYEEELRNLVISFNPVGTPEIESAQPLDPNPVQCAAPSAPVESQEAIEIAPVDPNEAEPGMRTIPGYETRETRAGVEVAVYHVLPWIDYGAGNNTASASLDWDIPQGATRRNLTGVEITRLLGGTGAVDLHLDWGAYELTGWAAWYEDGSFWGAYLMGYKGPMDHFEFAVTAGDLPPTCIVFGDSVEQEIWGISVTADKYDGKEGCARRVSFMKDDYGYRFDLTATGGTEEAEELVSRAVTWVANGDGLDFASISSDVVVSHASEPEPTAVIPLEDGASSPSRGPQG